MYKNNPYIQNHAAVSAMGGDLGVSLDQYDAAHGLAFDAVLRAQYKHWRATETGVPQLLSADDRALLGL